MDWIALLQGHADAIVDHLRWLVEHETPTEAKGSLDRLGHELAGRAAALGGLVTTIPQSDHGDLVRVEWPGTGAGQLLILTHIDTVWPLGTLASMPFRVADGRAFGPGVLDMKAGVAMVLAAVAAMQRAQRSFKRRVVWLITTEEEIGSPISRPVLEHLACASDYALVLEPAGGEGALKTARKGVGSFTLRVTGRPAHAGADPHGGISAIEELAHQVIRLHRLNDPAAGTTVNVGLARGGTRRNVVAAEASAQVDLRVTSHAEADRVTPLLTGLTPVLPGATIAVTGGLNRPPMERTPTIVAAYERVRSIGAGLGLRLGETSAGGGSDGNFTAALGVPTIDGLGAVGRGAHAHHEQVIIRSLIERAALLAALLEEL